MCKAMEDMCNEVKKETRLENLKNLMKTLSLTIEQAMDALKIPEADREIYKTKLYGSYL